MLASALAALGLILAAECALYPGVFEAYAGRHASQVRSTEGRLGIWKRSAGLVRALALAFTAASEDTAGFAQPASAYPPGPLRPLSFPPSSQLNLPSPQSLTNPGPQTLRPSRVTLAPGTYAFAAPSPLPVRKPPRIAIGMAGRPPDAPREELRK
jgi:hypothetical protein